MRTAEVVSWVVGHAGEILFAATSAVTAASAVAALTPTPKDDNAIKYLRKIVDALALNFGHARNEKRGK